MFACLVAAFVIAVAALDGVRRQSGSVARDATPAVERPRVHIMDVLLDYRENAARAAVQHGSGPVHFEMEVSRITPGFGGQLVVEQDIPNETWKRAKAYFDRGDAGALSQVKEGDTIRARGRFSNIHSGITMSGCKLE